MERAIAFLRFSVGMVVFAGGIVIGIAVSTLGETRLIPPIGTTQPVADARYVNESGDTMTGALTMPAGAAGTPALVGPDADSGMFFLSNGKHIVWGVDGVEVCRITANDVRFPAGSSTEPSIVVSDADTGFAYSSKGQALMAIVDGQIRAQFDSTGIVCDTGLVMGSPITRDVDAGLTASTTQTQGQGTLTSEVNEVATCANNNDTVTLPTAAAGLKILVINNGAKTLQIFPASGDNLGAGVDTSTTLSSDSNVTYQAYDATNWEVM
ncbi:MAG: hypothetical protein JSV08_07950 [Acidobacteriota bacterium]|nr:MAG: hypothetical protein JSV08_07950 [Acidobacteriota bacterium]